MGALVVERREEAGHSVLMGLGKFRSKVVQRKARRGKELPF